MQRYVICFEYDGTNFSGLQSQPGKRTVQEELERALFCVLQTKTEIVASGRTDAGVHALSQVAHFDADYKKTEFAFLRAVNSFLPKDICIVKLEKTNADFHARFDAKHKTYIYKFYVSPNERPLFVYKQLRVNTGLDVDLMKDACKYFVGTHDFKSFCSKKSGKTDFVRTVYSAFISDLGNNEFQFEICGNGFLYNMVRIVMGTLIKVGEKKLDASKIPEILDGKARALAGKTVPPYGLYLKRVDYD